jgi:hypothetical protein
MAERNDIPADNAVRLTIFAGACIALTIVVLIVLRAVFPGLRYPLTLIMPYGASVMACGILGIVFHAWRKSAAPAANFAASLLCFLAPAVTRYALVALGCKSITLECI